MSYRARATAGLGLAACLWLASPASVASLGSGASGGGTPQAGSGRVALRAGTIHLVEGGVVLEGGATVLVEDGRIAAVGKDVPVPFGTKVVDYGPSAAITPGLVAAYVPYGWGSADRGGASERTADPALRALDGFDFYAKHLSALMAGVTTAYVAPPEGRLIAGQGALVKLAGSDPARRVLAESAAIHGAIDWSARLAPGYWQPPLPATVDVGIGYQVPQLPKTTMGAIVALNELVGLARGGPADGSWEPTTVRDLAALVEAGIPWRIGARDPQEIRALLDFAAESGVPIVVDKADGAKEVADELAAAGVPVIYRLPYTPGGLGQDRGKDRDARWPSFDVPAAMVAAGVPVAITSQEPGDLLFAAGVASRGGLDHAAALRAITQTPAEILGVAARVGTIAVGKDADLAVFSAAPLSGQASVVATWVDGALAWDRASAGPDPERRERAGLGSSVVIEVDELHVGDGRVLRPGQIAIRDGRIVEVGETVSRPAGAAVARGRAAMPGIVDALGHLGLEGTRKVPATDFELSSIVAPGDRVDRRVALAGVTTVVLAPRGSSAGGAPVMAYKPAADDWDQLVLRDPVALRLAWTNSNRMKSGEEVRELLAKAEEYRTEWQEYEAALAAWTPPPPEPPEEEDAKEEAAEEGSEAKDEEAQAEKKEEPKKKKKGEEPELEPDPITGLWEAEIARPPRADAAPLKLRLHLVPERESGDVEGNLRCDALSEDLVQVEGYWDREAKQLTLSGLGSLGWIELAAKLEEAKLAGTITVGGNVLDLAAERKSKEWVVAGRPEPRKAAAEEPAPKGKPKEPKRDPKLEPVVAVLEGRATAIVQVDRGDEILECIAAFEEHGIEPVLYGAEDVHRVLDEVVGRVAGVLPGLEVVVADPRLGALRRTPYADLQSAGVPVAFRSEAEEGAIDLPLIAAYAVAHGMSPTGALRALTHDAAEMMSIGDRVGLLQPGYDGDVLLLDGPPLAPGTAVVRTWVNGEEVVAE